MLAVGSAAVFPFEMDTVMGLAEGRLVGTHYGFYNTIVGVGILVGNLATGWLMDAAQRLGLGGLIWPGLIFVGALAAVALHRLDRAHHLEAKATAETRAGQPVQDAYPVSGTGRCSPISQCEAIQASPRVEVSYARTG